MIGKQMFILSLCCMFEIFHKKRASYLGVCSKALPPEELVKLRIEQMEILKAREAGAKQCRLAKVISLFFSLFLHLSQKHNSSGGTRYNQALSRG